MVSPARDGFWVVYILDRSHLFSPECAVRFNVIRGNVRYFCDSYGTRRFFKFLFVLSPHVLVLCRLTLLLLLVNAETTRSRQISNTGIEILSTGSLRVCRCLHPVIFVHVKESCSISSDRKQRFRNVFVLFSIPYTGNNKRYAHWPLNRYSYACGSGSFSNENLVGGLWFSGWGDILLANGTYSVTLWRGRKRLGGPANSAFPQKAAPRFRPKFPAASPDHVNVSTSHPRSDLHTRVVA